MSTQFEIRDCHFCRHAWCVWKIGTVYCYDDDGETLDHRVGQPTEAETCDRFSFSDEFPKRPGD